jgi:hypothetical protein
VDKELIESQIEIMRGLILTYQQYGCSKQVLQTADKRLADLIELAK